MLDLGFSGDGEHDYLKIEKSGANTDWVARCLAQHAGVRRVDVGYAGLKDRYAITTQWFSVRRSGVVDWTKLDAPGVRILEFTGEPDAWVLTVEGDGGTDGVVYLRGEEVETEDGDDLSDDDDDDDW